MHGLSFLEEDYWDDKDYIDNLLFAHWIDCNSKCIYCLASSDDKVKTVNKHYNIYPAIEDLVEKMYSSQPERLILRVESLLFIRNLKVF